MKPEQIISKRFEELSQKAELIVRNIRQSDRGDGTLVVDSETCSEWSTSVLGLIQGVFGENSAHYQSFKKAYDGFQDYDYQFHKMRGIFTAAKENYQGGYLFKIKALIGAEVLDSVLEQASELLSADYKDPACVVAGVALETALKELCKNNDVPTGKLDKMNADLVKAGLYNVEMQEQITAWADRRNNAAHGNWDAYTKEDVKDMIDGVNRFIAAHL